MGVVTFSSQDNLKKKKKKENFQGEGREPRDLCAVSAPRLSMCPGRKGQVCTCNASPHTLSQGARETGIQMVNWKAGSCPFQICSLLPATTGLDHTTSHTEPPLPGQPLAPSPTAQKTVAPSTCKCPATVSDQGLGAKPTVSNEGRACCWLPAA